MPEEESSLTTDTASARDVHHLVEGWSLSEWFVGKKNWQGWFQLPYEGI